MGKNTRRPRDDQDRPRRDRRDRLKRHARLNGLGDPAEHDWPTADDHDKPRQALAQWLRAHAEEYAKHGAAGRLVARELNLVATDAERLGAADPDTYERLVDEEDAEHAGEDDDSEGYERLRMEWNAALEGDRIDARREAETN